MGGWGPVTGHQAPQIVKKIRPSQADLKAAANVDIDQGLLVDDFFDYSKVVVKKPWGYEYLIYQNDFVAVWILYLKKGFKTSMHCHPNKKTSITILSGEALCSTLGGEVVRLPGEAMLIGKGVFHRTASISDGGTFVMEIETPVNKRDLLRFKDEYGREKLGYESIDHFSFNLQNFNYFSLLDPKVYYNVKKRFGNCSIQLGKFAKSQDIVDLIKIARCNALCILNCNVINHKNEVVIELGDMIVKEDMTYFRELKVNSGIEALILNKSDTMTRLSDFIVSYLKKRNLKDVFFVPETSNAHLIDAVGRDNEVRSVFLQTEHAATLAAESYAKLTGKPGVVFLSSGSSATNALTGIANAWVDSTPMLVISGQSRPSDLGVPGEQPLRQLANKELNIIDLIRPITKYAKVIGDAVNIKEELERAFVLCHQGRPGPAWLDVPIDILGMNLDEADLPSVSRSRPEEDKPYELGKRVQDTLALLKNSSRPVMLAGHGIRAAGAQEDFIELVKALQIPVLASRRGIDLLPEDFPLYFGRPGTYGQRAANFVIQNADLIIVIGSRLSLPLVGRNYKAFARAAKKVIVNIDSQELAKGTVSVDLAIIADAGEFIKELCKRLPEKGKPEYPDWLDQCRLWNLKFPPTQESNCCPKKNVNPYYFIETLSEALDEKDIIVVDGGPSLDYVMQTFKVKAGQRIISSPGLEHQGFALPGSIGACLGSLGGRIVCLCEKKGLQLNIPELQSIVNNKLPIKIFIFNSKVNPSIKQMQSTYFGGRYIGSHSDGVIGSLNVVKLGEAYKIETAVLSTNKHIRSKIDSVLRSRGPVLCEVTLPEGQEIIPRMVFTVKPDGKWLSKPIEDMYPFLDREQLRENMIIDILEED